MAKRLVLFLNSGELFLSHRQHLAQGAAAEGYDVTVLVPEGPGAVEVRARGYKCETVKLGRKSLSPLGELLSVVRIFQTLKRLKPDVLHSFTIKPVLYGTLCARLLGIPSIVNTVTGLGYIFIDKGFVAGTLRALLSPLYKIVFRSPRVNFIFQNKDDFDLYRRHGWVDIHRSQLIPGTGVDVQTFQPNQLPTGAESIVLYAGRYLKDKGLLELFAACRELAREGQNIRLLMCGKTDPGNPNSLSDEEFARWRQESWLEDLGFQKEMAKIYAKAHVVCLPSYREGIPLTLIEAAACGKALLATDVPGCRDVVTDGETGLLIPAADSPALKNALKKLITDKDLRDNLGERARAMAIERFAKEPLVKRNLGVYRKAG